MTLPTYKETRISTNTIIAISNSTLNLQNIYDKIPIAEYNVPMRKRGRKKKNHMDDFIKTEVLTGSIVLAKYENNVRGNNPKSKKTKKFFRNSLTVIMFIDDSFVNFKVSQNGKFQMTGCRNIDKAYTSIRLFWDVVSTLPDTHTLDGDMFEVVFIPAMQNVDFDIGFMVNRENLSRYINVNTEYYSILEASFGYTGANIKFPLKHDIMSLETGRFIRAKDGTWNFDKVPYSYHLKFLNEKEKMKKIKKQRYNTFLIFNSGRCLLSGITGEYMVDAFNQFIEIVRECRDLIEQHPIF
jgi:TATA-box binding protein (TBP) (component of TFIID and TFIIIB)